MKRGRLFVISGPSGVGKSTILKELLQRQKDIYFSVSATISFLKPIKPIKFGIAIQPLTISAKTKINSKDINGPIVINVIKTIL